MEKIGSLLLQGLFTNHKCSHSLSFSILIILNLPCNTKKPNVPYVLSKLHPEFLLQYLKGGLDVLDLFLLLPPQFLTYPDRVSIIAVFLINTNKIVSIFIYSNRHGGLQTMPTS